MDKKTFTRIIGRLEDEGILQQVAKGVYYINGDEGYSDQKIIEYYVNNFHGMIIGSSLFSKLNIKDNEDGLLDIITNKIDSNKTIGKFKFYKVEIPLFDNDIIDIITLLELFESLREPYDNNRLLEVVRKCIFNYNDSAFELVIKNTNLTVTYHPRKGVPVHALKNINLLLNNTGMVFITSKSGSGNRLY